MRKPSIATITLFVAAFLFLGIARAQQNPAPKAPPPAAAKTPAAQQAPAAKTAQAPGATAPALKTEKDKESYALGMNLGTGLREDAIDVDPDLLLRGFRDALAGGKTLLSDQEAQTALALLQAEMRKKQEEASQAAGETNKKEGDAFMASNKTRSGVVTLPSGLQYMIVKAGTGPMPSTSDTVVCNYRGTLLNGTEFDSSYKRGQPATFQVGGVIKGFSEALQLMPVGSTWRIFIPADLAYGARDPGAGIGPNSTLTFEVELLSIQGKAQ
jgi:FKBP-type peptidyl-prolyl cis-trans isomerase FklB